MTTEQRGRAAPWAKILGAVLLALTAALMVSFVVANSRASARERDAFDSTRADARRFADSLLAKAAADGRPSREQVLEALTSATGNMRGNGALHTMSFTDNGTRIVAQFSRVYERPLTLFGQTETMAHRCFTFDFPPGATEPSQVRIEAHGADESCSELTATGQRHGAQSQ
ncbi:hypothetical protein HUT18_14400 [Streptomyces sp. NA04227]|uniref:hypothetical protein n=1 Tax=Streptomyces sp. NA04227 TaxID=2742136 RepID=UPI0015927350|nr:hypothetical protein [Streptomyces sp. NA04227]QKW07399.1 hypothetical protein HUT18_14400 [Streptomyces sp. NA04227]